VLYYFIEVMGMSHRSRARMRSLRAEAPEAPNNIPIVLINLSKDSFFWREIINE